MRARLISAVFCAAIFSTTVGSSLAFQDKRTVNVNNPSTVEDSKPVMHTGNRIRMLTVSLPL